MLHFATLFITIFTIFYVWLRKIPNRKRVAIVVLGDIGRSPRMQYHAISSAECGYIVDVIGYKGSNPDSLLSMNRNISLNSMPEPPCMFQSLPKMLCYAAKAAWQAIFLLIVLCKIRRAELVLVQNPPSIPTMAVVWFMCRVRSCKFTVDWHNYGYTIMALSLGEHHKLVKIAKAYEHLFGRMADANICVTRAMQDDLRTNWNISACTHHDRAPLKFKRADLASQHRLFLKLSRDYDIFKSNEHCTGVEKTVFTVKQSNGNIHSLPGRPALIVSSTSWTEDEDFNILLSALEQYELSCELEAKRTLKLRGQPNILCVITGKGPMKSHYMNLIKGKAFRHIQICTPWLEPEDYPILLGSSDLGVCLHTSSSGLDLPMKVVDMFGCGLPVCAVSFKCLHELVKHDKNGMIFHCANELSLQLEELLDGFPTNCNKLQSLRRNLDSFQSKRWHEYWQENVLPIYNSAQS